MSPHTALNGIEMTGFRGKLARLLQTRFEMPKTTRTGPGVTLTGWGIYRLVRRGDELGLIDVRHREAFEFSLFIDHYVAHLRLAYVGMRRIERAGALGRHVGKSGAEIRQRIALNYEMARSAGLGQDVRAHTAAADDLSGRYEMRHAFFKDWPEGAVRDAQHRFTVLLLVYCEIHRAAIEAGVPISYGRNWRAILGDALAADGDDVYDTTSALDQRVKRLTRKLRPGPGLFGALVESVIYGIIATDPNPARTTTRSSAHNLTKRKGAI